MKKKIKQEFKGYNLFTMPTADGRTMRMDIPEDASEEDLLKAIKFIKYLISLR